MGWLDDLTDPGRLASRMSRGVGKISDFARDQAGGSDMGSQLGSWATDRYTKPAVSGGTTPKDRGGVVPAARAGGDGGGGGRRRGRRGGPTPIMDAIMAQDPGMDRQEARQLARQYKARQQFPGLSDFVSQETGGVDPNTMQMFFAKTVAPYLKQTSQQFQQGAQAGTAAMQSILSGAAPSPAIDVLKSFLPVHAGGQQALGAALEGATITAPYYDQLLSQLQENISQQQRSQFYSQQAATAQPAAAGESALDPNIVKLLTE